MVPKSSTQRWSREASRESETPMSVRGGLAAFQKPNLPPLEGTPSSRRQYSYGAAAEPQPARPGRGLQRGQELNLTNAIRSALTSHEEDELHNEAHHTFGARSQNMAQHEDEPATASYLKPTTRASRHILPDSPESFRRPSLTDNQPEDARSFGMESDYYGDATIRSSPAGMPPPGLRAPSWAKLQMQGRKHPPCPLQVLTEHNILARKDWSVPPAGKSQISGNTVGEKQKRNSQKSVSGTAKGQADQSAQSADVGRRSKAKTLGPSRLQFDQNDASASGQDRSATGNATESRPQTRSRTLAMTAEVPNQGPASRHQPGVGIPSSAAHLDGRAGISADDSLTEDCSGSGRWLNGATKATIFSNFSSPGSRDATPRPSQTQGRLFDSGIRDEPTSVDWWQILTTNLRNYVEAVVRVLGAAWQRLVELSISTIWVDGRRRLVHGSRLLPTIMVAVLVVVLGLVLSTASWRSDSDGELWAPTAGESRWYSPSGVTQKLGGYLSSLDWPSRSRWTDLDDLWSMDDWQRSSVEEHFKKLEQAFRSLQKASKLHELSLKKLESVVPKVVHMELRDGKPVIDAAFWHALRDLILEDEAVLSFYESDEGAYTVSSERQLKALASRLAADPILAQQIDLSVSQAESRLDGKLTHWERWVRENEAKRRERSALDQVESVAQQQKWEKQAVEAVEERIRDFERRNTFVTRDEYLRYVQSEASTHGSGFGRELEQLKPQLEKMVRELMQLAAVDTPTGMSRSDVTALVNGLMRKAFSDVNLEALANGKIHAHWETELRKHVNYFTHKAGAHVDAQRSSAPFDAAAGKVKVGRQDETGVRAMLPPSAALEPWHDDGDCWCAALSHDAEGNLHGARLAVVLAHRIVPQHLVIEHILPGATTDADARPRDVELYAYIEDETTRERLRDFAAAHFPDTVEWDDGAPPDLGEKFVKIAHTVYRGDELHGGIHVHRLSEELLALGAVTEHVVVRAISNYGSRDYTCFYRVRLYGRNVDVDVPEIEWR